MGIFSFLVCLLRSHQPDRNHVIKLPDGTYLADCLVCGCRLKRRARMVWVRARGRQLRLTDRRGE